MEFEIVDVSEKGVRFLYHKKEKIELNKYMIAVIRFRDGESYEVAGRVVRHEDDKIALQLERGIPYRRIIDEQRMLAQKYPRRFGLFEDEEE